MRHFDRALIRSRIIAIRIIQRAACAIGLFAASKVRGLDADDGLDLLISVQGDDVDDRDSPRVSGRIGAEFVGLERQDASSASEE